MLDFKEKRVLKRVMYSRLSIFVLVVLVIFVFKGVLGAYNDAKLTEENKKIAEQQLHELKEREESIASEISSLKTVEGQEKEIREKFRVVKEGEQMVVIVDEKPADYLSSDEDKNFWKKTKEFFGF